MSLSRCPFANLSILVFSHLDCSAYVLPQVTVEQQMRQCTWYFTIVFTVTQPLLVPSPEHLVQAAFEERWTFHTEILEVLQPEDLRGKLKKSLMVLFLSNRPMNRGEKESLNISHLAQERSKLGQGGQLLGETQFYLLYTVQLHHTENFLNVFFGPWNNFYLLTAQVHGAFPLLHPPEEVGEEFDRGLCLETKFYVYHQGSQWVLCPWHVLSHWCHQWAWGHMVHVSRPHVPEVLASISQVQHPQFASPVGKQKIRWDSLKYSLNETTASELRQHSNFPSVLLHHIPDIPSVFSLSSLAHFPPAPFHLPSFSLYFYKVFPNVISAMLKASEHFQKSLVHPVVIHSPWHQQFLPGHPRSYQATWFGLTWGELSGPTGHQDHPALLVWFLGEASASGLLEAGGQRARLAPWPSGSHCVFQRRQPWIVVGRAPWADTPKRRWPRPHLSLGSLLPNSQVCVGHKRSSWLFSEWNPVKMQGNKAFFSGQSYPLGWSLSPSFRKIESEPKSLSWEWWTRMEGTQFVLLPVWIW